MRIALVWIGFTFAALAHGQTGGVSAKALLTRDLALAGKEAVMVTVDLAPGASSPKHRHNAHVFVYVLEGSVVMQVEGQPAQTLVSGQTFYENPADVHAVSRNASQTEKAKFLVFFVKEKGAPNTVMVHD